MGVVAFDYSAWALRYPELAASVTPQVAALYFAEAGLYCNNSTTSPVTDETVRAVFLNMLTAHIAALNIRSSSAGAKGGLVGRISNAAEGSVNVQLQADYPPGTSQWYQQTQYGSDFYAASAGFRTMLYVPGHPRPVDPFARLRGYRGGNGGYGGF